jgi:hypothetical protein
MHQWVDFCNDGAQLELLGVLELDNDELLQASSSRSDLTFILWVLISFLDHASPRLEVYCVILVMVPSCSLRQGHI